MARRVDWNHAEPSGDDAGVVDVASTKASDGHARDHHSSSLRALVAQQAVTNQLLCAALARLASASGELKAISK